MEFDGFVLAAATDDLSQEPLAREHADAVEFRMDFADAPLDALAVYDGALPVIATNRVDAEGGDAPDTPARLDALCAAAECDAVEAVDVELAAVSDGDAGRVVECAREHGTSVVVSAHDFEGTPTPEQMQETLSRAAAAGDVGKLAVTAEHRSDVLDLLAVTEALSAAGTPVATMAMGEAGRHSRAVAPLYGSRVGYAPVEPSSATAPGQYDLATLADLIDRLGGPA
jgi:3-dehydroquinate dehydratase-1